MERSSFSYTDGVFRHLGSVAIFAANKFSLSLLARRPVPLHPAGALLIASRPWLQRASRVDSCFLFPLGMVDLYLHSPNATWLLRASRVFPVVDDCSSPAGPPKEEHGQGNDE